MSLNSRLKWIGKGFVLYPPSVWVMTLLALLCTVRGWTGDSLWLAAEWVLLLLYGVVGNRRLCGRIPWLMRDISDNFYAIRNLRGRWMVFQKQRRSDSCKEITASLIRDCSLMEALKPGEYRAVTHDPVLKRIRASDRASILSCRPAYKARLAKTLMSITHKRCKKCKSKCRAWRSPARQFYDVIFTVT